MTDLVFLEPEGTKSIESRGIHGSWEEGSVTGAESCSSVACMQVKCFLVKGHCFVR